MSGNLFEEMTEETRDLFSLDSLLPKLTVQRTLVTYWAYGDTRYGQNSTVTVDMFHDGRLTDWAPSLLLPFSRQRSQ